MFIDSCSGKTVCHIGVYAGDSKIIESAGSSGIVPRDIPKSYYFGEKIGMKAIYRPIFGKASGQTAQSNILANSASQTAQSPSTSAETSVFDAPIEGDSMIYSLTPSFKFHKEYDIKAYDVLKTEAKALIKESLACENNGIDLIGSCIKEGLVGKHISQDCQEPIKTNVYNDFVDKVFSCVQSDLQSECICDITPTIPESDNGSKFEFIVKNSETGVFVLQKKDIRSENEYVLSGAELKNTKSKNGAIEIMPAENYNLVFLYSVSGTLTAEVNGINAGKKLYIYKNGTTTSLLSEQDYSKGKQINACEPKIRRSYKFCYFGKEKFLKADSDTGLYGLQTLTYRFALFFGDNIAPTSPNGLFADDLKLSESSLLIKANKPTFAGKPIDDLDHYKIYCSKNKFLDTTNLSYSRKVSTKDETLNLKLDNCNGQLIENGKEYFIAVSAVDKSGNEIKTGIVSVAGKSVDDLSPGKAVSTILADTGQSIIRVGWQPVTKNYDGSILKDLASYRIYYSKTPIAVLEGIQYKEFQLADLKELTANIDLGDEEDASNYNAVVIGIDDSGNTIKDATESYDDAFKKVYPNLKII
jgi:hypothetical protein